jgi:Family of unknown function (DUF6196)
MQLSPETPDRTRARLLGVLGQVELRVLDGTYAFSEHQSSSIPVAAAEGALALVRDDDMWSVLQPVSARCGEPLRVFMFHFPAEVDNSGFVGWLAGHLKAVLGTGVLVICGFNPLRGGVFDYCCVPERVGEAAIAEVHRLRASGR